MPTYESKIFNAIFCVYFDKRIAGMDISVIQYIVAVARFIRCVATFPDVLNIFLEKFNFREKFLKSFPRCYNFTESVQGICEHLLDNHIGFVDAPVVLGEIDFVLERNQRNIQLKAARIFTLSARWKVAAWN
jgi:hypothetical protein